MNRGAEVTCLGAIGHGAEVRGRGQRSSRGGADVAGISAPQILAPSSDSKAVTKFSWLRLISFVTPSSRVISLLNPSNLLNRRI